MAKQRTGTDAVDVSQASCAARRLTMGPKSDGARAAGSTTLQPNPEIPVHEIIATSARVVRSLLLCVAALRPVPASPATAETQGPTKRRSCSGVLELPQLRFRGATRRRTCGGKTTGADHLFHAGHPPGDGFTRLPLHRGVAGPAGQLQYQAGARVVDQCLADVWRIRRLLRLPRRSVRLSGELASARQETMHYKVGTANIDVVDARRKQLIWVAVAEGRLTGGRCWPTGAGAIGEVIGGNVRGYPGTGAQMKVFRARGAAGGRETWRRREAFCRPIRRPARPSCEVQARRLQPAVGRRR